MKNNKIRAALISVAALIVVSCNTTKRLQKQNTAIEALKAQWIFDWVQHNPCPALPEINLDSICGLQYTVNISPTDSAKIFGSGIMMPNSLNDSSELFVSGKDTFYLKTYDGLSKYHDYEMNQWEDIVVKDLKNYYFLKNAYDSVIKRGGARILVPYKDDRLINLLQDSVRALQIRSAGLTGGAVAKAQDCTAAIKAADKKAQKWIWLFIAACGVIVAGIAWKVYKFFSGGGVISKLL